MGRGEWLGITENGWERGREKFEERKRVEEEKGEEEDVLVIWEE